MNKAKNNTKPNKKSSLGFLGYVMRISNYLVIFALFLSILASFISPKTIWFLAFFGLAHPYIYVLNVLFFVYWLLLKKKFLWIPLAAMIFSMPITARTFNFRNHSGDLPADHFKIMTYNVHVFDLYHPKYEEKNRSREDIVKYVEEENPDILCLQEFYSSKKDNNIELFEDKLGYDNHAVTRYSKNNKKYFVAIFSRFPILNSGDIHGKIDTTRNFAVFADIRYNHKIVRVYSVHLQSIKLYTEQNLFTEDYDLAKKEEAKIVAKGTKRIAQKMKSAFLTRSKQIQILKEHINNSPYPVILCGDFNDTPTSYAYSQLSRKMKDAFLECGSGLGKTYNGPFPSFRIDNILHNRKLVAYEYKIGNIDVSDHFPVSCSLGFKE